MNVTHRATANCFSIFGFGFIFLLFFLCPWVVEGIVEFRENKSFAGLAGFTYGTLAQYVRVAERTPNEVRKSERGCSRVVGEATTVFS